MKATTYIKKRQILWAQRRDIKLQGSKGNRGEKAYTRTVEENLFEKSLSEDVRREFEEADGNELRNKKKKEDISKIQAVHSSAALTCNIFSYWRSIGDIIPIAKACRIPSTKIDSIKFEQKLPIDPKRFKRSPNIDVLISYKSGQLKATGVECKFSEAYRQHSGLKLAYITTKNPWNDIPEIHNLAKAISPEDTIFKHLHAAQLIKHILGLKQEYGKTAFRLLYLWYDVSFNDGYLHRKEIEKFREISKADGIKFQEITYQEVIINLAKKQRNSHKLYIDYLADRYL